MRIIFHVAVALCLYCVCPPIVCGQTKVLFEKHVLNPESEFSAAGALDVNQDGRLDIVCGAWWYAAPTWTPHRFRDVEQIRGRYDDYANLTLDVDLDGDVDIISVNYRSKSLYWCRNPGGISDALWEKIVIDEPGTSETGRLVDIDGDGRLDVLPNGTTFAAWYQISTAPGQGVTWQRHALPQELAGHGIGAGDLNGDGRVDVFCPRGWAEGPVDARHGRWRWHPEFNLADDCGLPILCHDVDQDGDMDLVWARGHNIGLYWTEQVEAESSSIANFESAAPSPELRAAVAQTKWITHAIDTSWACGHTLLQADIDGDGRDDIVAGKRFMGHDGKDPGENDPLSIYWYRFDSGAKTWHRQLISSGGSCAIDLDSAAVDLDADGDIDILAPARSGLHWLENLRIGGPAATDTADQGTAQGEPTFAVPAYAEHDNFEYLLTDDGQMPLATALDHGVRRQQILLQMQQVMGDLPDPALRVPLDIQVEQIEDAGKYSRLKLTFAVEPGDRVPAYLLIPHRASRPLPAMLCLHPTHFELGKAQICGLGGQPSRFYAHELAAAGYVCLAPDYPGFAEYKYDFAAHGDRYASGSMKAIWNNIRGLDLLESLPCVDRDKIGAIGHSLGGHNALFTAAFDQRVRCVVTSCGFNAWEDYYGGNLKGWTSDRYMPRISSRYANAPRQMPFDFPEVLAAITPRPIFVNAPLRDANFAVAGVRKCEASLAPLLELFATQQRTVFVYPDAEHDFPQPIREQAYDWLKEQLR